MNCVICEASNWHDLDFLRDFDYWYDRDFIDQDQKIGFKVCKECGFVTYDKRDEEWLKDHYDRERLVMNPSNIITCNRKNRYHRAFLEGVEIYNHLPILDVGCAQGAFLHDLKNYIDETALYGTEWSEAYRAWAKYEYGLDNVTKDINEDIQYGFISYYHVLEHIQEPGEELEKVRRLLKDDGLLYISVPIWLHILDEPGGSLTVDYENLYHLNHHIVFSYVSFKNLLYKYGFEIVKEDTQMYGYTVLCKKVDKKTEIVREDYKDIIDILGRQKEAMSLFEQATKVKDHTLFEKAVEVCNNYVDAYIAQCMSKDMMKDFKGQLDITKKGLANCPDSVKLLTHYARIHFQFNENDPTKQFYSNNIKTAEKTLLDIIDTKPGSEDCFKMLGIIEAKYKRDFDKAVEYMRQFIDINPSKFMEGHQLIAQFWREKEVDKDNK